VGKKCAFSVTNAACNSVTSIPLEEKIGPEAFLKMFGELEEKPTRRELNIPSYYPTDPQAEVLVFGDIEPTYIDDINVKSKSRLKEYERISKIVQEHKDFVYYFNDPLFTPRMDWAHWKV